ncbi:class I SAM-dependent methyltransferase [Nonomuraea fuscirosea]|uniref:class I SAM-dependent methyltransferase n=1 Tax=Nonomuraea fuscirosea TaxID=1291556 RepID=UPI002DD7D749|nr:class I SAM-dependent methyltransferase [Nonomuraea fuscirosea]
MTTSTPDSGRTSMSTPGNAHVANSHRQREMAESFGVDAERYDRTRPAYPDALIDQIIATSPGRDVLDVGCGTGTAMRQFLSAGCTVLGVEPDPRMAAFARRGGLDVEEGTFETWDPAGRTFDVVAAGTAWHWIDPIAGVTQAARILRPGGRLAAFWHVYQLPAEVFESFTAAFRQALPVSPVNGQAPGQSLDAYQPLLTKAANGIREAGGFAEPEQWRHDWERTYTRDEWLDQLPTSGTLTRLPREELEPILNAVGAAIDALGGRFTLPYATMTVTATRLP